ncbi:MAG: uroporphyrinogen-III synthase [Alphaproteobacteria bacterium]
MRLLVTRPQPDASAQVEKLETLGHAGIVSPLLEVEFLDFSELPLIGAQALIATSRNALRALAASGALEAALQSPLYVVGAATADLARELGFGKIYPGAGTARELLQLIEADCASGDGILIHLAGTRLAFDLKSALEDKGFEVEQPVLYRTRNAAGFSEEARAALGGDNLDGVILMSPMTAQTFVTLIDASDLSEGAKKLTYFCLSNNVAEPLKALSGARVLIAGRPREDDLLALIGHEAAN